MKARRKSWLRQIEQGANEVSERANQSWLEIPIKTISASSVIKPQRNTHSSDCIRIFTENRAMLGILGKVTGTRTQRIPMNKKHPILDASNLTQE